MKWFEPIGNQIKDTKTCGHAHERSITFFAHLMSKKMLITNGILQHLQLDSHKTQGHEVNLEESLNKLNWFILFLRLSHSLRQEDQIELKRGQNLLTWVKWAEAHFTINGLNVSQYGLMYL